MGTSEGYSDILLSIPEAQLHEVENGQERLREHGPLQLVTHTHEAGSGLWIQIGRTEWCLDTAMPTLEAAPNTYMFAMEKGKFFSILLAKETSEDLSQTFREILVECTAFEVAGASKLNPKDQEEIMAEVANGVETDEDVTRLTRPQLQPGQSPTTSQRILTGAAAVQEKLLQSANWASRKIIEQSENYQAKHEATQNPVKVSPGVQRTVRVAKKAAEAGSYAANKVAGGIADVSIKMADAIVKHLGPTKYGEELNDPNKRPHAAKEVAAAALMAAVGIYDSMEQASRVVLGAGGTATSDFIGHKYGPEARQVSYDATSASITGGMAYMTVTKIGLKKVARKIAKRTATGLVKAYVVPTSTGAAGKQGGANAASSQVPNSQQSQPIPSTSQYAAPQGQAKGYSMQQQSNVPVQGNLPAYSTVNIGDSSQFPGHQSNQPQHGQVSETLAGTSPDYQSPFAN